MSDPTAPDLSCARDAQHDALRRSLLVHAPHDGTHATAIAGLQLYRHSMAGDPISALYEKSMCVIVQGAKRVLLGNTVFDYGPWHHLVASQDLPASGRILKASAKAPYLCLQMAIDSREVASLMLEIGQRAPAQDQGPTQGMYTEDTTPAMLDALLRLLRLLDTPQDVPALAPLVQREILYRLLTSPNGWRVARSATPASHDRRISRVIRFLRERYRDPLPIAELAAAGRMSESALHLHFKAVTAVTPLQYQKLLRLQEARRLLLTERIDAATAANSVGYRSASQFSREYARLFGAAPLRDRERLLRDA